MQTRIGAQEESSSGWDHILNEAAQLEETDEQLSNGRYLDVFEVSIETGVDLAILLGSGVISTD